MIALIGIGMDNEWRLINIIGAASKDIQSYSNYKKISDIFLQKNMESV